MKARKKKPKQLSEILELAKLIRRMELLTTAFDRYQEKCPAPGFYFFRAAVATHTARESLIEYRSTLRRGKSS